MSGYVTQTNRRFSKTLCAFTSEGAAQVKSTPEFTLAQKQNTLLRRLAAERGVETKRLKTLDAATAAPIRTFKIMDREKLTQLVFERESFKSCNLPRRSVHSLLSMAIHSDPAHLERLMVEYLLLSYTPDVRNGFKGCVSFSEGNCILRRRALAVIREAYPWLANACDLKDMLLRS
ncbi:MAG: hypothetical protein K8U57_18490 [Planctomycetes bacterium]|nr:hypothetical protein [Planctomycetota bacterium]